MLISLIFDHYDHFLLQLKMTVQVWIHMNIFVLFIS